MSKIEEFTNGIRELSQYSIKPVEKELIQVSLIVNPIAGRFRRKKTLEGILAKLEEKIMLLKSNGHYQRELEYKEYITEKKGDATEIAKRIVGENGSYAYKLIIVASGDGTYNEAASGVIQDRPQDIRLLHIPLGSGNDTAEIKDISKSYDLITGLHKVKKAGVLRITDRENNQNTYAFNIASVGLDAYIAHSANAIKRIFGESSYKIASKVSPLFWRGVHKPLEITVYIALKGYKMKVYLKDALMMVMGCDGNSSYGHGMKVLPDKNNLCIIDYMNLGRLISSEKLFYQGNHIILPEVHFYDAREACLYCQKPLWMQRYGETTLITTENMPIIFQLLDDRIQKVIPD